MGRMEVTAKGYKVSLGVGGGDENVLKLVVVII